MIEVPHPAPASEEPDDDHVGRLIERRRCIREWWDSGDDADLGDGAPPVGLALSGGGIRSATFSLGLIQALAKSPSNALDRIDLLSTVSGGGYIGCFLRSLFVPESLRGIRPKDAKAGKLARQPDLDTVADQYRLARRALRSDAHETAIDGLPASGNRVRNPIWWLREHSRYLAPTGPTDYFFALAYLARNWVAMLYIFAVASVAIGAGVVMAQAALWHPGAWHWPASTRISPLVLLLILPLSSSAALSIGFWGTEAMSTNEPTAGRQWRQLLVASGAIFAGALVTIAAMIAVATVLLHDGDLGWLSRAWEEDSIGAVPVTLAAILGGHFFAILILGILLSCLGATYTVGFAVRLRKQGPLLAAELRRRMTAALATSNTFIILSGALALVDSLGAALDRLYRAGSAGGKTGLTTAVLMPALAFLIKKLPDWFGGSGTGAISGLVRRFATPIAFVAGVLLYGVVAVTATALVHHVAWSGMAWTSAPTWPRLWMMAAAAWVLALLAGASTGFINLSSLHALYASRLTRAYLGASNVARLELTKEGVTRPITENHLLDYIQPRIYGETDLPAPVHLINVTLNETIDPQSQLVARDRKGDILCVGPGGIRIGAGSLTKWSALKHERAEAISLGDWCAISGAAASAGMGRMTNLGFAVALTFANVRLGYWWWAPSICPNRKSSWPLRLAVALFGTFIYLANEMTARYSRGYNRKYLTDGGHFEDSGAYPLIRRGVPLILVSDNGADPNFAFEDLQVLVRQVRIDLGGDIRILGGDDLGAWHKRFGTTDTSIFVDPQAHPDWRERLKQPTDPAFVLVLRVKIAGGPLHLVWLKPRILPDIPEDLSGYATSLPDFPQQATGDQFFDEAQWECYRKLGEVGMARLLAACPRLLDASHHNAPGASNGPTPIC